MGEGRDDPMRLWIGKWTPERPRTLEHPQHPLPVEKSEDQRRAAPDADRVATAD